MSALQTKFTDDLAQVEALLRATLTSDVPLLNAAGQHILGAGGKRLRPLIVLQACRALGGEHSVARALPLAAAVELLHTASLIHDDINDQSDTRRGRETINALWGRTAALLAGDFVFVKLLHLAAEAGAPSIRLLAWASESLVAGETLQLLATDAPVLSEEHYMRIIGLKTAALFAACGALGALAAAGSEEQVAALREYGYQFGLAYQMRDDLLDLAGDPEQLGKPVAADLAQGKRNLAVIWAMRQSDAASAAYQSRDTESLRQLLDDTGAIAYAMRRTQEHAARAKAALTILPQSPAREALSSLTDLAAQRQS
jgi:octaprenyl-diphosphate synthase